MEAQGRCGTYIDAMLRLLREFEERCLAGDPAATPIECQQLCTAVERRLRSVYGEVLVLRPHILPAAALEQRDDICEPAGAGASAAAGGRRVGASAPAARAEPPHCPLILPPRRR